MAEARGPERGAGTIQDHQKDLRGFDQEARGGQDALVRTFAQNIVPAIQEHLGEARVAS